MKAAELCHTLAVDIGAPNLNANNVPSIETVLTCCQGLLAVDKEASTVRLIHFTLQENLRAHPVLFGTVQATMAEICLSYLNSQQVRALPTSPAPHLQGTHFLEYCSVYWGVHARRDLSNCAKRLSLELFSDYTYHISIKTLLKAPGLEIYSRTTDFNKPHVFSSLHCASLFGIVEVITDLIEVKGCDVNQRDCLSATPLGWAAFNGHKRVVKILLKRGDICPNGVNGAGQTPLYHAALRGHAGVVKMLLERGDVDPNKPDISGITPLFCAAWNGHEGVAKVLLERNEVNPDRPDNKGRTPLWAATHNGHAEVAKMLVQRSEVNTDEPDSHGRTPLRQATRRGHTAVVVRQRARSSSI